MIQAVIRTKAGRDFSTMKLEEIESQKIKSAELKVKMVSSRINPVDMDLMKGFPTLKYKSPQIGGIDGAGIVTEVYTEAYGFSVGDKVFFYRLFSDIGTWAEEIVIPASYCAKVPNTIDVQEAGAIALPLLTAYDSLMQLNARKGEKILIHGVGGGVGLQALQIAKQLGLKVIGTASLSDQALLKQAGVEELIDYKTQDFSKVIKERELDYILDTQGGEVLKKSIALQPKKIVSLKYVDTNQMIKAGVELPGIMKWLMKLMMSPFTKLARKNNVELIGQVTGANGRMLQNAVDMVAPNFISRSYKTLHLTDIAKNGMNKSDIGKVIVFE